MFGQHYSLSQIESLRDIRKLRFQGPMLHWEWCLLPSLTHLFIGNNTELHSDASLPRSLVYTLEMVCLPWVSMGGRAGEDTFIIDDMAEFISCFANLAHQTLYMTNDTLWMNGASLRVVGPAETGEIT
jgi:hypothetical protein